METLLQLPQTKEEYRRALAAVLPADEADAGVLARVYRVGATAHRAGATLYDNRLGARVLPTAAPAVRAFAAAYWKAHGYTGVVNIVTERLIRLWEVVTGQNAGPRPQ